MWAGLYNHWLAAQGHLPVPHMYPRDRGISGEQRQWGVFQYIDGAWGVEARILQNLHILFLATKIPFFKGFAVCCFCRFSNILELVVCGLLGKYVFSVLSRMLTYDFEASSMSSSATCSVLFMDFVSLERALGAHGWPVGPDFGAHRS